MSKKPVVQKFEEQHLTAKTPDFKVGDTVRVHTRIIEGSKERIQVFMGTVIARKGSGLSETFSVHRVAYGEGMERVFLLHSPRIAEIEVVTHGDVRRGKLYYLRGTQGKKAKVKALVGGRRLKKEDNGGEQPQQEEELEVEAVNGAEVEATIDNENHQVEEATSPEEETEKADA